MMKKNIDLLFIYGFEGDLEITEENKDEQGTEILSEDFDPIGYGKCTPWGCECKKFIYQNGSNKCATRNCGHNYKDMHSDSQITVKE